MMFVQRILILIYSSIHKDTMCASGYTRQLHQEDVISILKMSVFRRLVKISGAESPVMRAYFEDINPNLSSGFLAGTNCPDSFHFPSAA